MPTPQAEYPPIGAEHRSVAVLGKGFFGEVHKALHTRTATHFAIKILSGGGKVEMKKVNIISRLCHVS
jgi:serine/threonine protein kinase